MNPTRQTSSAKIELRDLSVRFGSATAVEAATLEIRENELVCLIGASGCGKTTLLNVIAGLLAPTDGEARVDGEPVSHPGPDRVVVFQDDAVFPWYTVRQNIEYGLRIQGMPPTERAQRRDEMIDLVGLAGREDAYPRELSGGMRKRVDVARALAVRPAVLLMDEPYSALDAMTKERLQVEFLRIHKERPRTVVFVTHDLEEAIFLGDRVIAMGTNPGHIHASIDVDFPRPRDVDLKLTSAFQDLRGRLARTLPESREATGNGRS